MLENVHVIKESFSDYLTYWDIREVEVPVGEGVSKGVEIYLDSSYKLLLIPSNLFPLLPPIAIMDWGNSDKSTIELAWDSNQNTSTKDKLLCAINKVINGKPPYKVAYGIDAFTPITDCQNTAIAFSWNRILINESIKLSDLGSSFTKRMEFGLVKALGSSSITVIGIGSVGSYMTEQLVRSGLDELTIIDPDIVEGTNISRTVYTAHDINRKKTDALEFRLKQINPNLSLKKVSQPLQNINATYLESLIENSDLVIAATDDPQAQALINSYVFYSNIPTIFIGLYKGAKGGEIAITIPTITPCFRCMTGLRREVENNSRVSRETNYGTNRLEGEIALNCDIQHVSSAALRICCSLISALKGEETSISNFASKAIAEDKHFLTIGMDNEYWFYPQIFENVPGQYAFQSVWLTAEKQNSCPVCGTEHENKENPYSYISTTPNLDKIRERIHHGGEDD